MLELHHWEPGPNSGEALILLEEKGLAFDSRYVDVLAGEQFDPAFLELNRDGQVPVLVHDGRALTETGFILQYLEAAFPERSFTPATVQGRYWAGVWIKYVEEYLAPAAWRLGVAAQPRPAMPPAEAMERAPPERRQAWTKAAEGFTPQELEIAKALLPIRLERMEAALRAGEWLAGADYSIADIAAFPTTRLLPQLTPDLVSEASTPRILDWMERVAARPAVRAALARARLAHIEYAPGPGGSRWG